MRSLLRRLADNNDPSSLANRLRRARFESFERRLKELSRPLSILDVGGTEEYWTSMGLEQLKGCSVTLLNIYLTPTTQSNFQSLIGDARDLSQFRDQSFDIIFSNSVIEHVGGFADQLKMANEVRRVGKRYLVQTPNFWFPIEPHYLFPGFQFLPTLLKATLLRTFPLGWAERAKDWASARADAGSIRLLDSKELSVLFPESKIERERIFGITKSLTAVFGFEAS